MNATSSRGLVDYPNVPGIIGALIDTRMATLHELSTVYSVEDAYDLLEIAQVGAHNRAELRRREESEQ